MGGHDPDSPLDERLDVLLLLVLAVSVVACAVHGAPTKVGVGGSS